MRENKNKMKIGNYNFCNNCHMPVSLPKWYCNDTCQSEHRRKQRDIHNKRERRQAWLESLHKKVEKVIVVLSEKKDKLSRVRVRQAKVLLEKIEDQYTTITMEIFEKRKRKKSPFRLFK